MQLWDVSKKGQEVALTVERVRTLPYCSLLSPGRDSMALAKERKMLRNRVLFLANCHYSSYGNVEVSFHLTYHSYLQTYETIRRKIMPRMQRKKHLSHFSVYQRAAPLACVSSMGELPRATHGLSGRKEMM